MDKKILLPTFLFILFSALSIFALWENKGKSQNLGGAGQPNSQNQIILFYGDGCPHCAIVEEYLKENQAESKISFAQKEVYYNQSNAKELEEKAKLCGMPTDSIGVPFLWDGEKCIIGDRDIIEFFEQKVNEK
ncbi:hypothetical protein COU95_00635 [Candidatus Shapirobacteria bacterium CG10_big_fil_rev_8_21_14_0_10_40_9]|uniref:Uncharacterized protein n=1 Tax=Candidatus Shapirobacteria bacterium CG10_big_fil_rev_8_21_14_0_10_40_9 TaxID=1974888 RepID=A0A2M8L4A7_9BACT|nr:MAG: hypothetical protein COU95_00635 [Candidatus Shapirobacteria bacterium CG10_big_fil_rev_8_21_14_0_10_40_9]